MERTKEKACASGRCLLLEKICVLKICIGPTNISAVFSMLLKFYWKNTVCN